jgi:hypothetical protein
VNSSISYYWNSSPFSAAAAKNCRKLRKPTRTIRVVQIEPGQFLLSHHQRRFQRNNAASGVAIPTITSILEFIFTSFNVLTTLEVPVSRINNYGVNTCVY